VVWSHVTYIPKVSSSSTAQCHLTVNRIPTARDASLFCSAEFTKHYHHHLSNSSDILPAADRGDLSALVLLDMTAAFDPATSLILTLVKFHDQSQIIQDPVESWLSFRTLNHYTNYWAHPVTSTAHTVLSHSTDFTRTCHVMQLRNKFLDTCIEAKSNQETQSKTNDWS